MNTELDPKTIYPGTTIAQMSGVDQVLDGNISSNEQKHDGLRPDLQDLLDRTSDELTSKDKQKVKSLLIENQNLFASSDVDLGRTNLGKPQVIHVDRLKKKNKQTLRTESDNNTFVPLGSENDIAENDTIETPYSQDIVVNESTLPVEETQEISDEGRRPRRKPAWMADYVVK
ncbi:unnamed protein product [Mytilus edulis]|uniref:Uncharacterized protein n=1 Tax=Mytilus edulis TaxID=6550 RepID=A0A8S3UH96_MYTED|nr:unnamed protein product [Mytilus edulis]